MSVAEGAPGFAGDAPSERGRGGHVGAPTSIDALLFDLGGVVIQIDFRRAFAHWAAVL